MKNAEKLLIIFLIGAVFILSGCSKNDVTPLNESVIEENENNAPTEIPAEEEQLTPSCGNDKLEEGEECDGDVPTSVTCKDKGYDTGDVSCTTDCKLDYDNCVKIPIPASSNLCNDTDEGRDYSKKGTLTVDVNGTKKKYTDYCRTGKFEDYVYEYYCVNDSMAAENYDCANGCSDGKCYPG